MGELACPCGCRAADASAVHAVNSALAVDDLDAAIERGLTSVVPCSECQAECRRHLDDARKRRLEAWAARERHRSRQARLQRQAEAREARRAAARNTADVDAALDGNAGTRPALPGAAAAALARAKARAALRGRS